MTNRKIEDIDIDCILTQNDHKVVIIDEIGNAWHKRQCIRNHRLTLKTADNVVFVQCRVDMTAYQKIRQRDEVCKQADRSTRWWYGEFCT